MKALVFLLLPLLSFAQPQIEKTVLRFSLIGHNSAKAGGLSIQREWQADNGWFGAMGAEYLLLKEAAGFGSLNAHAGYFLSNGPISPLLMGGFGAGLLVNHGYGAYAEGGGGLSIGLLHFTLLYRTGAFANCPVDLEGWYGKIGINL